MRIALLIVLTTLALASFSKPAVAQQATSDEQVVVVGTEPTREAVRRFVDQMAITPPSVNQLARWDRRICPGVAGLRTRYAQFLIDRMAQRAFDVGLDVGRPGCGANVLIVVSPDPDAIARELATEHMRAMGVLNWRGRAALSRAHLQRFVESDAPVRWWHVNRMYTRDGEIIDGSGPSPGMPTPNDPSSPGRSGSILPNNVPVMMMPGNATRVGRMTRQDFRTAFIIVDAHALEAISFNWEGLADYIAMVSLAQLDPQADTSGYPTILNLFAPRGETVRALTDWDIAYLRGLYDATRDARSANQQEGEITRSMARDLAPQP